MSGAQGNEFDNLFGVEGRGRIGGEGAPVMADEDCGIGPRACIRSKASWPSTARLISSVSRDRCGSITPHEGRNGSVAGVGEFREKIAIGVGVVGEAVEA